VSASAPLPIVPRALGSVLLERARQYPIVTLTGPRQSGKTTLCRMAFPELPWVSLESPDVRRQAIDDPRGLLSRYPDGAILDEVQRAPDLLSYLQDDVDRRPEARGRWVLTGSHNVLLLQKVSQTLAGRTALLNLLPLGLDELPPAWVASRSWLDLALQGGYPAPLHRGIPPDVWLGDYVATYLDRDVRDVLRVGDLSGFERFVRLCAGRCGQILNLSALGADAGIAHNTARAWLSVLETTYVAFTLQPWAANLTSREVKSPKLYFWDTGLLCWLLGLRRAGDLDLHPLRGAVFENFVAVQLLKRDLHRGVRPSWWFYRDGKGLEADLLQTEGLHHLAVEVKSGATVQPEWSDPLLKLGERMRQRGMDVALRVIHGGEEEGSARGVPAWSWRRLVP
jgi:predicted AAA+ superfamily ATPase